ncbi:MAG: hypothetical protein RID91_08940 [Azospirillaceae bacterium]
MTNPLDNALADLERTVGQLPEAGRALIGIELARLYAERRTTLDALVGDELRVAMGQLLVDAVQAARPALAELALRVDEPEGAA